MIQDARMAEDNGSELAGVCCPHCGCRHLVYQIEQDGARKFGYKRPALKGREMRVRYCRNCRRRVVTYERVAGGPDEGEASDG